MEVPVLRGTAGMAAFYDANKASKEHRGWAMGAFITDQDGEPLTLDFEVKLCENKAGEERSEWSRGVAGSALTIILSGTYEMIFAPDGEKGEVITKVLTEGMAAFWENSVPHRWRVITDTKLVCIRRLS